MTTKIVQKAIETGYIPLVKNYSLRVSRNPNSYLLFIASSDDYKNDIY